MFADVDADSGKRSAFKIEIDESLHFVARGFAPIGLLAIFLSAFKRVFDLLGFERPVEDAAGAGLERLTGAGPRPAGHGQQRRFLAGGNRAAMRMTSSAPGRSKSTISVEQRPVMTSSRASCPEGQLTSSIPSCSRVACRVCRDRLS